MSKKEKVFTKENVLNFNRLCLVAKFNKREVQKDLFGKVLGLNIFVPELNGTVAKELGMVAKRVGCRWKVDGVTDNRKRLIVKLIKR